MRRVDVTADACGTKVDNGLSKTKACSLVVLMHTAASFYMDDFSSDGDGHVASLSLTSLWNIKGKGYWSDCQIIWLGASQT